MTQRIDVKLIRRSDGVIDIDLDENGDLLADYGLETTIRLSVYGRRRATEGEVQTPEYRGGWIGNALSAIPDFEAGSKIWLLQQSRLNDETKNDAKSYIEESLEWMIEDGLAKSIEVSTSISNGTLEALIKIDGAPFYMDIWNNTIN